MAEGGGLLNRYTGITRIVGSNPIPSATQFRLVLFYQYFSGCLFRSTHKITLDRGLCYADPRVASAVARSSSNCGVKHCQAHGCRERDRGALPSARLLFPFPQRQETLCCQLVLDPSAGQNFPRCLSETAQRLPIAVWKLHIDQGFSLLAVAIGARVDHMPGRADGSPMGVLINLNDKLPSRNGDGVVGQ